MRIDIDLITKNISYGIFIQLSIFIKDSLLKETIYKMIEKNLKKENIKINSSEVIKTVEKHHLDKKYISVIIKYIQYIHLKKGFTSDTENIIQFKSQFFKDYFEIGKTNAFKKC